MYGKKNVIVKNFQLIKIKNYKNYNTLIIDGEGIEEHFIKNLKFLPNIKYIIFELHTQILSQKRVNLLFKNLKINKINFIDNCFNSFYFKKDV